jgi:hypothetical protein
MIDLLLALHGLAQRRGDGLLPELAERLRKTPRIGNGRMVGIDGDAAAHRSESAESSPNKSSKPASRVTKIVGVEETSP